ncbi:MAG: UDP-3-O-(3-hydroxymyristoyl)glucosamine N-acyltransferase [candidate division Zixibacteria bacterium]|nr:UDP-3-O-(3-hydroxymyristoyl)glucosamine N-acyltransferase [candidate division Zixibacteria bacterium]
MEFKLSEIAEKIGAELVGNDITVSGLATIDNPKPGTLTFITSKKYRKKLADCICPAVIVPPKVESDKHSLLVKDDPYLGFGLAMRLFHNNHYRPTPKIENSAAVSKNAEIGKDAYIGHHAVIENNAKIGDNCVIHSGVIIARNSVIGDNCFIYPNAVIMHDVIIGSRSAIYAGVVIGSDGFGYARDGNKHIKIPQTGIVVLEDDVEIGANTTIDRATIGETRIGTGAIIDNLVQIAHNCRIGAGSIICAQVGVAGTTTIGKNVILAGQVGIAGHLTIGDGVIAQAQSGIPNDISADSIVFGTPAREVRLAHRVDSLLNHLPDYIQRLREVEKKLNKSEK